MADAQLAYVDEDGDGYGSEEELLICGPQAGAADNRDDCDDAEAGRAPGAIELCDGLDNDCDAEVDEGGGCEEGSDSATEEEDVARSPGKEPAGCSSLGGGGAARGTWLPLLLGLLWASAGGGCAIGRRGRGCAG